MARPRRTRRKPAEGDVRTAFAELRGHYAAAEPESSSSSSSPPAAAEPESSSSSSSPPAAAEPESSSSSSSSSPPAARQGIDGSRPWPSSRWPEHAARHAPVHGAGSRGRQITPVADKFRYVMTAMDFRFTFVAQVPCELARMSMMHAPSQTVHDEAALSVLSDMAEQYGDDLPDNMRAARASLEAEFVSRFEPLEMFNVKSLKLGRSHILFGPSPFFSGPMGEISPGWCRMLTGQEMTMEYEVKNSGCSVLLLWFRVFT